MSWNILDSRGLRFDTLKSILDSKVFQQRCKMKSLQQKPRQLDSGRQEDRSVLRKEEYLRSFSRSLCIPNKSTQYWNKNFCHRETSINFNIFMYLLYLFALILYKWLTYNNSRQAFHKCKW